MKKMFLAAAAALAMLASCSKDADEIADTAKGGVVKITLTDKTPAMTRAFFGTTAAAESWEKEDRLPHAVRLRRKRPCGPAAQVLRRGDLRTGGHHPVPDAKPGEAAKFYVVANSGNPANVADLTELRSSTESEAASYNGTFDEVTTKAVRSGGFTMTGSTMKAIAQAGQTTDVQIGIERLVAKIAVQTATDSKFAAAYPGRVKIASATVSRAASSTPYFNETQHSGGVENRAAVVHNFSQTQASKEQSGKYANLFYVYGSENSNPAENVLLTLEGVYDNDGDFATTADQIPISYEVEPERRQRQGDQPQHLPPCECEHQRADRRRRGRDDHPGRLGGPDQSGGKPRHVTNTGRGARVSGASPRF